jgi:hypothetical protein
MVCHSPVNLNVDGENKLPNNNSNILKFLISSQNFNIEIFNDNKLAYYHCLPPFSNESCQKIYDSQIFIILCIFCINLTRTATVFLPYGVQ